LKAVWGDFRCSGSSFGKGPLDVMHPSRRSVIAKHDLNTQTYLELVGLGGHWGRKIPIVTFES